MVKPLTYHRSRLDSLFLVWAFVVVLLSFTVPAIAGLVDANVEYHEIIKLLLLAFAFSIIFPFSMFILGLDHRSLENDFSVFFVRLLLASAIGSTTIGVLAVAVAYYYPSSFLNPIYLYAGLSGSFFGILTARWIFRYFFDEKNFARHAIIVGTDNKSLEIYNTINSKISSRYKVVGLFHHAPDVSTVAPGLSIIGESHSILKCAQDRSADLIIVGLNDRRGGMPVAQLLEAKLHGIEVIDGQTFFEREFAKIELDGLLPSWIIFSPDFQFSPEKRFLKRGFDIIAALILILLTSPLMLAVSIVSLIESRGKSSILYFQSRIGCGGVTFRLCKFRSMVPNAERDGEALWASKNDSRVTRIGGFLRRYRVDELPQLFNILKGQMSLVGPRPERPKFVQELSEEIPYYIERHTIKPGLAGWAQLMYPYGSSILDAKKKLEYDLYYIKHASVAFDIIILIRTIEVVLLGKGAH
jgi:sugar transferase (PEP-CTERM system associated)